MRNERRIEHGVGRSEVEDFCVAQKRCDHLRSFLRVSCSVTAIALESHGV